MQEHHFKLYVPFATFVEALRGISDVTVVDESELHCIGTLRSGGGLIARPAYPDATDLIVGEEDGDSIASGLADLLADRLGCQVSTPRPFENA